MDPVMEILNLDIDESTADGLYYKFDVKVPKRHQRSYDRHLQNVKKSLAWLNREGYPAAALVTNVNQTGAHVIGASFFGTFLKSQLSGYQPWIDALFESHKTYCEEVDLTADICSQLSQGTRDQPKSRMDKESSVLLNPHLGENSAAGERALTALRLHCSLLVIKEQGNKSRTVDYALLPPSWWPQDVPWGETDSAGRHCNGNITASMGLEDLKKVYVAGMTASGVQLMTQTDVERLEMHRQPPPERNADVIARMESNLLPVVTSQRSGTDSGCTADLAALLDPHLGEDSEIGAQSLATLRLRCCLLVLREQGNKSRMVNYALPPPSWWPRDVPWGEVDANGRRWNGCISSNMSLDDMKKVYTAGMTASGMQLATRASSLGDTENGEPQVQGIQPRIGVSALKRGVFKVRGRYKRAGDLGKHGGLRRSLRRSCGLLVMAEQGRKMINYSLPPPYWWPPNVPWGEKDPSGRPWCGTISRNMSMANLHKVYAAGLAARDAGKVPDIERDQDEGSDATTQQQGSSVPGFPVAPVQRFTTLSELTGSDLHQDAQSECMVLTEVTDDHDDQSFDLLEQAISETVGKFDQSAHDTATADIQSSVASVKNESCRAPPVTSESTGIHPFSQQSSNAEPPKHQAQPSQTRNLHLAEIPGTVAPLLNNHLSSFKNMISQADKAAKSSQEDFIVSPVIEDYHSGISHWIDKKAKKPDKKCPRTVLRQNIVMLVAQEQGRAGKPVDYRQPPPSWWPKGVPWGRTDKHGRPWAGLINQDMTIPNLKHVYAAGLAAYGTTLPASSNQNKQHGMSDKTYTKSSVKKTFWQDQQAPTRRSSRTTRNKRSCYIPSENDVTADDASEVHGDDLRGFAFTEGESGLGEVVCDDSDSRDGIADNNSTREVTSGKNNSREIICDKNGSRELICYDGDSGEETTDTVDATPSASRGARSTEAARSRIADSITQVSASDAALHSTNESVSPDVKVPRSSMMPTVVPARLKVMADFDIPAGVKVPTDLIPLNAKQKSGSPEFCGLLMEVEHGLTKQESDESADEEEYSIESPVNNELLEKVKVEKASTQTQSGAAKRPRTTYCRVLQKRRQVCGSSTSEKTRTALRRSCCLLVSKAQGDNTGYVDYSQAPPSWWPADVPWGDIDQGNIMRTMTMDNLRKVYAAGRAASQSNPSTSSVLRTSRLSRSASKVAVRKPVKDTKQSRRSVETVSKGKSKDQASAATNSGVSTRSNSKLQTPASTETKSPAQTSPRRNRRSSRRAGYRCRSDQERQSLRSDCGRMVLEAQGNGSAFIDYSLPPPSWWPQGVPWGNADSSGRPWKGLIGRTMAMENLQKVYAAGMAAKQKRPQASCENSQQDFIEAGTSAKKMRKSVTSHENGQQPEASSSFDGVDSDAVEKTTEGKKRETITGVKCARKPARQDRGRHKPQQIVGKTFPAKEAVRRALRHNCNQLVLCSQNREGKHVDYQMPAPPWWPEDIPWGRRDEFGQPVNGSITSNMTMASLWKVYRAGMAAYGLQPSDYVDVQLSAPDASEGTQREEEPDDGQQCSDVSIRTEPDSGGDMENPECASTLPEISGPHKRRRIEALDHGYSGEEERHLASDSSVSDHTLS